MQRMVWALLIFGMLSFPLEGARTLRIPALPKRIYGTQYPVSALYPASKTTTCQYFVYRITLTNLTSTPQNGSLVLRNDSSTYVWGGTATGLSIAFPAGSIRYFVCNSYLGAAGTSVAINSTIPTGGLVSRFLIPANSTIEVSGGYIFLGARAAAENVGFDFRLLMDLVIREDRGAVLGAVLPFNGGGFPANAMCFGEDISNYSALNLQDGYTTDVPFFLNGGRPF